MLGSVEGGSPFLVPLAVVSWNGCHGWSLPSSPANRVVAASSGS